MQWFLNAQVRTLEEVLFCQGGIDFLLQRPRENPEMATCDNNQQVGIWLQF